MAIGVDIHKDDQPLFSGTHSGADGSATLIDRGAHFRSLGVDPALGQFVENVTQTIGATVIAATDDEVTTGQVYLWQGSPVTWQAASSSWGGAFTWNNGDEYKIYATSTKNQIISRTYVDLSRGWKAERGELVDGWRAEDIDQDDRGRKKVFGPSQPEPGRRY